MFAPVVNWQFKILKRSLAVDCEGCVYCVCAFFAVLATSKWTEGNVCTFDNIALPASYPNNLFQNLTIPLYKRVFLSSCSVLHHSRQHPSTSFVEYLAGTYGLSVITSVMRFSPMICCSNIQSMVDFPGRSSGCYSKMVRFSFS